MTNIGTIEIQDLFVGSNNAVGLYLGAVEVWSKDTPQPPPPSPYTKVKYTAASGLPDWEGDIVGELSSTSIPNITYAKEIETGNQVTSIANNALSGNTNITDVTIGDSVTQIGLAAFRSCSGLSSLSIGNGVTSIEGNAFRDCSSLTDVTIPDSVTSIGSNAFQNCSGLSSLSIGNGVTSIWIAAFYGCSGLTSVTIPASVTSIGNIAFSNCSGLTSVTMEGKTKATVRGMANYSWGLSSGCVLHCSDGDITV